MYIRTNIKAVFFYSIATPPNLGTKQTKQTHDITNRLTRENLETKGQSGFLYSGN